MYYGLTRQANTRYYRLMKRIVADAPIVPKQVWEKRVQKDYIRIPLPHFKSNGTLDFFTLLIIILLLIAAYLLGMLTVKVQSLGKDTNTIAAHA